MKLNNLIGGFIAIAFCACVANAAKIYVTLNTDGNYITNVPTPVADSPAVNKQYADWVFTINKTESKVITSTNAFPAKCAGGQISGYTPIPGEDLYSNMQYGVEWETNTRFAVDLTGSNVFDTLTGLMWTKNANIGGTKTWVNAIDFCTNLVYGGYSDWRLPNVRELKSLVDLSKYSPALPSGHPFSAVQSGNYWSSSTYAGYSDRAWYVHLYYGYVNYYYKTGSCYVWPVRSGR